MGHQKADIHPEQGGEMNAAIVAVKSALRTARANERAKVTNPYEGYDQELQQHISELEAGLALLEEHVTLPADKEDGYRGSGR